MSHITPIGISGFMQSGKDTFYKILRERLLLNGVETERVALADYLRAEVYQEVLNKFGINVFNCNIEEKNKTRPFLIEFAAKKRKETGGRYFIEQAQKDIEILIKKGITPVLTDIRFAEIEGSDEVFWLKNELKGVLVHIERYKIDSGGNKILVSSPIPEELLNDPKIRKEADFFISWPTVSKESNDNKELKQLQPFVDKFVEFYVKK